MIACFVAACSAVACGGKRESAPASPEELARSGQLAEAARAVAAAPLDSRPELAAKVTTACAADRVEELARLGTDADLLSAVADRIERERGPAASLPVRERAASAAPERAEGWDALGRARAAAGRIDQALAAWDRAAAAAPAQPSYRLAAIRALAMTGDAERARARAGEVARAARQTRDVDQLVAASAAAAAAGEGDEAVALAREARAARPGDGRLVFLLGDRLAEDGDAAGAARTWVELLICGAHGRPWHRHEVAGRLLRLGQAGKARAVSSALAEAPACAAVDQAELASYLAQLKNQLGAAAVPRAP
jgi:tetratricopeptide (TPR) repeat protein